MSRAGSIPEMYDRVSRKANGNPVMIRLSTGPPGLNAVIEAAPGVHGKRLP